MERWKESKIDKWKIDERRKKKINKGRWMRVRWRRG